jgi:hypothetical protein
MSEALTSQHPAEVKPLSEIPEIRVLEDGSKLLAETKAFLVRNASELQHPHNQHFRHRGNYRRAALRPKHVHIV